MSNKVTIANLHIQVVVECPHCDHDIDLMEYENFYGTPLNEEGDVINQALEWEKHKYFEFEDLICPECDGTFNVEGIQW